ncbi:GNAT family N-acetyltransferase [Collimonas sp. OK412]|jgi:GNAT superfamily N-acetyltransferase|uniref:GNAT family N-acetyltransferase n=1 Tax=Collimonas sp. (strain OK412) TaxID=1801619 RepID=UPI0008EEA7A8|nr:GNAT family N-acetyltransferase [Collimonas sp. OK412]SFC92753.1 Protein N-acetyltransferase, RimJ/RimL family [Collimonas sp. OK412]
MTTQVPEILFNATDFEARKLTEADLPALQDFFVANPEYFLAVNGMLPRPDEAKQEFEDRPPPDMPFDEVYVIGFVDRTEHLVGMATVLSNLIAPHVWHIGTFIVATSLHGTGAAGFLYDRLEEWTKEEGAHWLRLGAVTGNLKAERFWEKVGYKEIRRRTGVQLGSMTHTIRVFVKPLCMFGLPEYLSLVVRDQPEL